MLEDDAPLLDEAPLVDDDAELVDAVLLEALAVVLALLAVDATEVLLLATVEVEDADGAVDPLAVVPEVPELLEELLPLLPTELPPVEVERVEVEF